MNEAYIPYLRLIPFFLSLFLVFVLGHPTIAWLQKIGAGQRVRDDGPQRHLQKEGTPTMGGVLIIGAALVAAITGILMVRAYWPVLWDRYIFIPIIDMQFPIMIIICFLYYAGIGFLDDWLKVARGRSLGLKARQKLILQTLGAILFFFGFIIIPGPHFDPIIYLCFLGTLWTLLMVGASNAVNLADGLDGLATGLSFLGFIALAAITWGEAGVQTFTMLSLALAGSCLGFLWFNRHPARVFMGDVGSLALGAALAAISFWLTIFGVISYWVIIGICFVPFIEAASVIIQVISYKTTGKRVFKMSPLHHHFELSGWPEQKVVYTFWAVGALAAAVTVWWSIR